jgi:hypothetical protein
MAAKKGKTSKAKSLKSKHLTADQAGQVKGGLLPAVRLGGVMDKVAPVAGKIDVAATWKVLG